MRPAASRAMVSAPMRCFAPANQVTASLILDMNTEADLMRGQ